MPYYANVQSKANQFCVETAQAIRHYLKTRHGGNLRAPFIARDLTDAGIPIPKGGLRLLRNSARHTSSSRTATPAPRSNAGVRRG